MMFSNILTFASLLLVQLMESSYSHFGLFGKIVYHMSCINELYKPSNIGGLQMDNSNKKGNVVNAAKISTRSFITSALIIFVIMMISGALTKILPSGEYQRQTIGDRTIVVENSYQQVEKPNYPVWRWFTAPIEVLWSSDAVLVITIILFILIVSGSIYVLNKSHVIEYIINKVVRRYSNRKMLLLSVVILVFMLLGALMGIFEEMVPLVPIMIAFAISLGWDDLTGLGMSLLATGFGFSAALANPFSIGVAQKIAEVPLFSGIGLRIIIFVTTYIVMLIFMTTYVRKHQKQVTTQPTQIGNSEIENSVDVSTAAKILISIIGAMFVLILISGLTGFMSGLMLPVVGVLFLLSGILCGIVVEKSFKKVLLDLFFGIKDALPGVVLILMATSVKLIISNGKIIDTILYDASSLISKSGPVAATFLIYLLFFIMDLFVSSASAKAFLMMPIIIPLADMIGVTRQTAVQAFVFGDGFTNLLYPTSAVLLITLGIAGVSYLKWFKFVWKVELVMFLLSLLYLFIAVKINYGPI